MPHPLAGTLAPASSLIDVEALLRAFSAERPDPRVAAERVSFGTSGHRGSALRRSFNEAHVLAVAQAVCEHRARAGVDGPLFVGMDTHALSGPAQEAVLEVLAAHEVIARYSDAPTPTPVVSHAILSFNRGRSRGLADGIVITPSHNPPEDGGIKYNPPNGGPADVDVTNWIERRANELLAAPGDVQRASYRGEPRIVRHDFVSPYVEDLSSVIDMEVIASAGVRIGADPMGGSSVGYWGPIAQRYGLSLEVVNPRTDPTFRFVPVDHDGKIRMDCSSPHAMAGLLGQRERFDVAFGNDADADRHGIVTRAAGLLNPNHYLCVAIDYLFTHRSSWSPRAAIGKTLVTSSLVDRVAAALKREVAEVPVGFKWFVGGLLDGSLGFGGEESAGASFLRRDGTAWTTDKDGIILGLLAAEIRARTGRDPGERYLELTEALGAPAYIRIDAPATPAQKDALKRLSPAAVKATTLAGHPILERLTQAKSNGASIGGLKVVTAEGWFAARPSGTEDVYKIYAESFDGPAHLQQIVSEAKAIVAAALGS